MATRNRKDSALQMPDAPAPWKCRCETYWMMMQLPSPLPIDIYDPLEATHSACTVRDFSGGMGFIMIVRYLDTPVREYDELAIIPGNFNVMSGPEQGQKRMRITRIYVNQQETMFNGRRNWNIPKHLARFEFSSTPVAKGGSPPKDLTITVYPPKGYKVRADLPFFKAKITPMSWTPSFPLSTRLMPSLQRFVQPPIPAGEDDALEGSDSWKSFEVSAWTNVAKLAWVELEDSKAVVPKGWCPKVKPWSFGFWLQDATLDISKPDEWR